MKVSLITYTYNDKGKTLELIKHCRKCGVDFHEIVVVDDCSCIPFMTDDVDVKVIRNSINVGPGQAKRIGLSSLEGDVFFSLDADIRPSPKWLIHSLKYLSDPHVGIVGSQIIPGQTGTLLSRARHRSYQRNRQDRQVAFLQGGIWLIRREAWERVGGLDDYSQTTHEDIYLCRKMQKSGFGLISANAYPVYEKRKIDYRTYVKREAGYGAPVYTYQIQKYGLEGAARKIRDNSAPLIDYCLSSGELAGIYYDLLKTSVLVLNIVKFYGETLGSVPTVQGTGEVFAVLDDLLADDKKLKAAIYSDMQTLGYQKNVKYYQAPGRLAIFFEPFFVLKQQGFLSELEKNWLNAILSENEKGGFDFHYLS